MTKQLNSHVARVKKTMNRVEILNELQRCTENVTDKYNLPESAWEIWFRGQHLGSIDLKYKGCYAVFSSLGRHCGDCPNFMQALSRFIDSCAVVIAANQLKETEAWIDKVIAEPEIRTWGIREPKTLWQKIKGFFK